MKNIHLLTTDKPSRLWLSTRKENYLIFATPPIKDGKCSHFWDKKNR